MQSRSIVLMGLFYSTGRFHLCSRDLLFYWVCSILLGGFIYAVTIYCFNGFVLLFYSTGEVSFMQSRSIVLLGLFYCFILL